MEALVTEASVERMYIVGGIVVVIVTLILGGMLWHRDRMEVFCGGWDVLSLVLALVAPLGFWYIFQDAPGETLLYGRLALFGLFVGISLLLTLCYNISAGNGVLMALFAVWFKACLLASVLLVLICLVARCGRKK